MIEAGVSALLDLVWRLSALRRNYKNRLERESDSGFKKLR